MNIYIIGNLGGTNIGSSLFKAAISLGYNADIFDSKRAQFGIKKIDGLFWKYLNKRQGLQYFFNKNLVRKIKEKKIDILITTGYNPLDAKILKKIKVYGCKLVHFSTDDPWNQSQKANWFLNSLLAYDTIFTPRKSNMLDFKNLGCESVEYLKFGYDEFIFSPKSNVNLVKDIDVLFVGGADIDRATFFREIALEKINFKLIGSYWDTFKDLKNNSLGNCKPEKIIEYTQRSKINLCLVRKANRDGHVMRTFEMAAIGACMLVEDTLEHREIFGKEGDTVFYFVSAYDAARKIKQILTKPHLISKMAKKSQERVLGFDTYSNRLQEIINSIQE